MEFWTPAKGVYFILGSCLGEDFNGWSAYEEGMAVG